MSYVDLLIDECLFNKERMQVKKKKKAEEKEKRKGEKEKDIDVEERKYLADQVDYWYCCSIRDD